MSFELNDEGRKQPVWIEYVSGRVSARFLVKPRDLEFVEALNRRWPTDERLTPAGRAVDPKVQAERWRNWKREFMTHHVLDWDVTQNGEKAPINAETVLALTDGMQTYILEAARADDPRDYEVESPLVDSGVTSKPGATSQA